MEPSNQVESIISFHVNIKIIDDRIQPYQGFTDGVHTVSDDMFDEFLTWFYDKSIFRMNKSVIRKGFSYLSYAYIKVNHYLNIITEEEQENAYDNRYEHSYITKEHLREHYPDVIEALIKHGGCIIGYMITRPGDETIRKNDKGKIECDIVDIIESRVRRKFVGSLLLARYYDKFGKSLVPIIIRPADSLPFWLDNQLMEMCDGTYSDTQEYLSETYDITNEEFIHKSNLFEIAIKYKDTVHDLQKLMIIRLIETVKVMGYIPTELDYEDFLVRSGIWDKNKHYVIQYCKALGISEFMSHDETLDDKYVPRIPIGLDDNFDYDEYCELVHNIFAHPKMKNIMNWMDILCKKYIEEHKSLLKSCKE